MAEIAVQEQTIWPQAYNSSSPLRLEPQAVKETRAEQQQSAEYTDREGAELERYLPCHYFDYTIGTSFGGYVPLIAVYLVTVFSNQANMISLIAIMLSRLRMNVEECLEEFQTMLDNVWSQRRTFSIRSYTFMPREKYSHEALERALKDMVKRKNPDGNKDATFRQQNEDMCRW